MGYQRRQGGHDRGRKRFAVIETLAGQCHRKCARAGAKKLAGQRHHRVGRKSVGRVRRVVRQTDRRAVNLSGPGIASVFRIHKNYTFRVTDGLGEFGRELVDPDNLDWRAGKFLLECGGSVPGEAIVAAHEISVCDDEDAGHGSGFHREN